MAIDYAAKKREREKNSMYLKLPKEGADSIIVNVATIEEVTDPNYKFNFPPKKETKIIDGQNVTVEINEHKRVKITTQEGKILNIGNYAPWYAIEKAEVGDGDTIRIEHLKRTDPKKAEWIVVILKRGTPQAWDA